MGGTGLASEGGAGCSAGAPTGASVTLCSTDTFPCNAGMEINSAETIKTLAATIVIRESTETVPRGLKAVFEMLLVNNAPASVLPGWSNTEPISTTQETKYNA